jgi:predicted RNA-binding Zn-ribbon protein involved in translation (DUF1610 family)
MDTPETAEEQLARIRQLQIKNKDRKWPEEPDPESKEIFRTTMLLLDAAAKVPKGKNTHTFLCPLCGEQAIGRVDPNNHHTIATCKCTPWAHRTWANHPSTMKVKP